MAKKASNTGLIPWKEKLAAAAKTSAAQEAQVGAGSKISIKGGVLTYQGAQIPGNRMAVIVLDHVLDNTHYAGKYDPKNPSGPDCFALGRSPAEMQPHETVVKAGTQHAEFCHACPMNEWGSAGDGSNRKGCRNGRRLVVVTAGELDRSGESLTPSKEPIKDREAAYFDLPPTAIKAWAGYVKQLEAAGLPTFAVVTKVSLVPDPKTQVKLIFEKVEDLPEKDLEQAFAANKAAESMALAPKELDNPDKRKKTKGGKKPKGAPARGANKAPAAKGAPASPRKRPSGF